MTINNNEIKTLVALIVISLVLGSTFANTLEFNSTKLLIGGWVSWSLVGIVLCYSNRNSGDRVLMTCTVVTLVLATLSMYSSSISMTGAVALLLILVKPLLSSK